MCRALQSFDPSFRLVSNTQFGSDPNALPEMLCRGRSGFGVKELDKDHFLNQIWKIIRTFLPLSWMVLK
jgi:hypothetical protein